jgi:hypothetical protein
MRAGVVLLGLAALVSLSSLSLYEQKDTVPVIKYTREAKKLRYILQAYSTCDLYQKKLWRGKVRTYCNIFARDVLDNRDWDKLQGWFGTFINDYSYNVACIFPSAISILGTGIHTAYVRAQTAVRMGWIRELTPFQAQQRANEGIPIWIISDKFTHEAIVCPDLEGYNPEYGVLMAQAGESNGIFHSRDARAFGDKYKDPDIKYYEFPLITDIVDNQQLYAKAGGPR